MSLPVNASTVNRSFLGGDGQLEQHTAGDVWKDLSDNQGKFKPDPGKVDQIADLKVGVGASKDVTLGRSGGLSLTFGGDFEAHNQVQLLWPKAKELDMDFVALGERMLDRKAVLLKDGIPPDAEHAMVAKANGKGKSRSAGAAAQRNPSMARKASTKEAAGRERRINSHASM